MSNYTELSTLGEFGLIDHLTKTIRLQNPSTLKGIGDDAAVLDYGNKKNPRQYRHADPRYSFRSDLYPLKHLGYKSVAVNASDIYAMNGIPETDHALPRCLEPFFLSKGWKSFMPAYIWPVKSTGSTWSEAIRLLLKPACASASRYWEKPMNRISSIGIQPKRIN